MSFDLADIDRTVALQSYRQAGEQIGFDGTALFFEDLFRSAPFDPASTVPDASTLAEQEGEEPVVEHRRLKRGLGGLHPQTVRLGERCLQRVRRVPFLERMLDGDSHAGSNEWAVGGVHTENGLPLLANDPHLALGAPSTLYPIHLRAGRLDVLGSGFPGAPMVVVGHNRHMAWGATINPMDVTDVYQEQLVSDPESPSGLSTLYRGQLEPVIAIPEAYRTNLPGDGFDANET